MFHARVLALKTTPSAYLCALVQADVHKDTLSRLYACVHELRGLREQIRRVGINLNQLARHANEGRVVSPQSLDAVNAQLQTHLVQAEKLLLHVSSPPKQGKRLQKH